MKKQSFPHEHSEHAQSLVELAISLTFILLLLSGAVTFSMAYFSYVSISDAAQEGALYGSLAPWDTGGIQKHVQQTSTSPVDLSQLPLSQIGVTYSGGKCQKNSNSVTVTVSYNYQIFMPFIGAAIGGNTIPLKASATDTILTPLCPP